MKVTLVVDALTPRLSGIGRYTWELSERLPGAAGIKRVEFFANGHFVETPRDLLSARKRPGQKRLPRWLTRRLTLNRLRNTLVHGPNYFLPPEADSGIITVHDLSVFRYPETHPVERVRSFESNFDRSLRRARHVITDTETVRREIIEELGVRPSDITAISLGVGLEFRPRTPDELRPDLTQLGLQAGGYGLCVSTLEPRKKIPELLRAWSGLPQAVRDSTPLVLAGGKGWLNEALHTQIAEAVAEGWLKHLGFVPQSSLPALYAGAALFVYPSVYEGFGLPPIEAMACGVPTIVANRSCLPEVCGDAASYIDPNHTSTFTAALAAALADAKWREQACRKGIERAASFTWKRCAAQTAAVYEKHWRS